MHRTVFLILILFVTSLFVTSVATEPSSALNATDISGVWHTGEDNTLVEIIVNKEPCQGKVSSTDNPKGKVGLVILSELKRQNNKWLARIYAAKRDKYFDAELSRKGDILHIAVDVGFFTKNIEWTLKDD